MNSAITIEPIVADIDRTNIIELCQDADVLFNMAAQTSHMGGQRDPVADIAINAVAQVRLIGAMREAAPKATVVHASTRQFYGRPLRLPVDENKVAMLVEENVLQPGEVNALTDVFGLFPPRLDEGLARLANSQPEQLPDEGGTGPLVQRIFYAFLAGVQRSPSDLFDSFRRHFSDLVPESTMGPAKEPVAESRIEKGATLTLSLPMRGHVQVRVIDLTDASMTVATLAGHPLAGSVTFRFTGIPGEDLRFEVETCDRPATPPDALAMYPLGILMKRWNWAKVVERTAEWSGARPPIEVKTSEQTLTGEQEREALQEIRQRVDAFSRDEEKTLEMEAKMRLETAVKPV